MEHEVRQHYCFRTCFGGVLTFVLLLVLFCPAEAFSQTRYWSTSRGLAGARIGSSTPRIIYPTSPAPTSPVEPSQSLSNPPQKISDRSQARASLRYDSNAVDENKQDTRPYSRARDSVKPHGVNVELFIDAHTDAHLRMISARTGISYKTLLYNFLRIGHTSYAERLLWGQSPYVFPPSR